MKSENNRRDFDLPEEDEQHLNTRGLPWETIHENNQQWLVIDNFSVPQGYNHSSVSLAIMIPGNYPTAGFDMVYFYPALSRIDRVHIPATESTATIRNCVFQRWSRHFTPKNPWRPEVDNVSTYLSIIEEWLAREFRHK